MSVWLSGASPGRAVPPPHRGKGEGVVGYDAVHPRTDLSAAQGPGGGGLGGAIGAEGGGRAKTHRAFTTLNLGTVHYSLKVGCLVSVSPGRLPFAFVQLDTSIWLLHSFPKNMD